MEAETVNNTHIHEFNAKSLVRSGDISETTEQGTTTCVSGDTFTLASGTLHCEVVGDVGVRFLVGREWTAA